MNWSIAEPSLSHEGMGRNIIVKNFYVLSYNNGIFITLKHTIMPHIMEVTTYSKFRQHLKHFLDKVFLNQGPLYISRNNGEDVVVLAQADYESIMETQITEFDILYNCGYEKQEK